MPREVVVSQLVVIEVPDSVKVAEDGTLTLADGTVLVPVLSYDRLDETVALPDERTLDELYSVRIVEYLNTSVA